MSKRFGALAALDDVSMRVDAGSVHALLGENGAGKSTLVKCIMGFYHADEGSLLLDGREVDVRNPRDAARARPRHGLPALHPGAVDDGAGEPGDGARRHAGGDRLGARARAAGRVHRRHAVRCAARHAGARPRRRREAEGGNSQAALSRRALPHSRRADLGADPAGSRRDAGHDPRHGARAAS